MDLTFQVPTAILLFTALDFASITSHIHKWVLFLLWHHPFILSGVISPLISSSILGTYQPVHPKGDQSWVFIGRTDAEAETPVFWPPRAELTHGKDPDAGWDWGQEEKGMTEDEMAGWHHRLNGHEFEWTPGVGDGQEGLVCYDSWGH